MPKKLKEICDERREFIKKHSENYPKRMSKKKYLEIKQRETDFHDRTHSFFLSTYFDADANSNFNPWHTVFVEYWNFWVSGIIGIIVAVTLRKFLSGRDYWIVFVPLVMLWSLALVQIKYHKKDKIKKHLDILESMMNKYPLSIVQKDAIIVTIFAIRKLTYPFYRSVGDMTLLVLNDLLHGVEELTTEEFEAVKFVISRLEEMRAKDFKSIIKKDSEENKNGEERKTSNHITGKAQKFIFDNLDKLVFNLAYSETSRQMKMALATLYDAWRSITANNSVEVRMFINGREIGRCPVKKLSLIKPRRK